MCPDAYFEFLLCLIFRARKAPAAECIVPLNILAIAMCYLFKVAILSAPVDDLAN